MEQIYNNQPTAPAIVDLDQAHVMTRRWFLCVALADFQEAKDYLDEALHWGAIGEARMQSRAAQIAALFYARPFQLCNTPSRRTCLKLPGRFLDPLDQQRADIHRKTLNARNRLIANVDMTDCVVELCISSDRSGLDFGAACTRAPTLHSDLECLAEILDAFIASIKVELGAITSDLGSIPAALHGTQFVVEPARDD